MFTKRKIDTFHFLWAMYFCSNSWDLRWTFDFEAFSGKLFSHSCFRHCVALILQLWDQTAGETFSWGCLFWLSKICSIGRKLSQWERLIIWADSCHILKKKTSSYLKFSSLKVQECHQQNVPSPLWKMYFPAINYHLPAGRAGELRQNRRGDRWAWNGSQEVKEFHRE